MPEWEENGEVKHLVPAVSNVDVFAVKCSSSLRSVVKESGVILDSFWEGERELGGRVGVTEKNIGDGVTGLIASVPLGLC
jgi:hypothetical protein